MTNEKILNTRVSKKLYEEISRRAKKNRVSVSNLMRNLVEDALDIHEDIHDAIDKTVRNYLNEHGKVTIIGYNEMTVARSTVTCELCEHEIKPNEKAYLGLLDNKKDWIIVCEKCKTEGVNFES